MASKSKPKGEEMKLFRVEYCHSDQPNLRTRTTLHDLAVFTSSEKEAKKKLKRYSSAAIAVSVNEVTDKSPKGLLRAFGIRILV